MTCDLGLVLILAGDMEPFVDLSVAFCKIVISQEDTPRIIDAEGSTDELFVVI